MIYDIVKLVNGFFTMNAPLDWAIGFTLYWLLLGIGGSLLLRFKLSYAQPLYLLGVVGSLGLLIISCLSLRHAAYTAQLPLGIPLLNIQFSWDSLSAFFVLLLSISSIGIGLFSSHYFHRVNSRTQGLLFFNYHLLLASIVWVFLSADAYSFMMAWEFMTLSSYLLIVAFKSCAETSYAGFLYILMAHLGATAIFLSFSVMSIKSEGFSFDDMRHISLSSTQAGLAFVLAFIGFGVKAGLLPLHIWIPETYSAAPSPIAALMSGIMLKTSVYGMLRVFFDLLSNKPISTTYGWIVLTVGLCTALFGVILAIMQIDMKRLLAYSSIENIGIVVLAIGLSLLFNQAHYPIYAGFALVAALFHCMNHSLFKSLLFLCTGSVLHATGERNLGKLGGLLPFMPWVAGFSMVGTLAMAGIPPLNGFVSEWLLLQVFLYFSYIPTPYQEILVPIAAAGFALTLGLAAYMMVKFYGIIFLGKPREHSLTHANDASILERLGLGWLALGCLLLGVFPFILLNQLNHVATTFLGHNLHLPPNQSSWLYLIQSQSSRASYSPLTFFCAIIFLIATSYLIIQWRYHVRYRRSVAWDCGYPLQTPRMQDTAEGFGQPIKRIFADFLFIKLSIPSAFDTNPYYFSQADDRFWHIFYMPILNFTLYFARKISKLQQGKISHYLIYSFSTLLLLLWWVL